MTIRVLSFHARYRCAHSGACCTSSWPIPVEADRLELMRSASANGQLRSRDGGNAFDFPEDAPPETPALLSVSGGRCAFFDDASHRCRVHTALGHDALPLACRQFPRVVVTDPRGVSVVLSHYCPTAAGLLGDDARVTIIDAADAFPSDGEYVGLDARHSLPPLLRPDMLMDWESWWEFERLAVDYIANSRAPIERVLEELHAIVEAVRTWAPGPEPLIGRIRSTFAGASRATIGASTDQAVLRQFLAAHAFANWTAHLGQGLRTWLRSIEAAHALMTSGHDVRHTDLMLRHLSDPHEMAKTWSAAETESPR
jgi:Fe-S-cluster containining protein